MEVSTRKSYFIEEDDLAETEMNKWPHQSYYHHHYSISSPRSGKFNDYRFDKSPLPHFLDTCFLCKKRLGDNKDIFMYRGDTPFCSEECREEQIERDEEKMKKKSLSSSVKAMRRNENQSSSSSSPNRSRDYAFRTGTVVAA